MFWVKKILSHFGSAKEVFCPNKSSLNKIDGVGKVLVDSILNADVLKRAEKELLWIEQKSINHIFCTDKNYHNRLKQCIDATINLFYK